MEESEFKIGEFVVFLSDKAKGSGLFTKFWNKDHVLPLDEISEIGGTIFRFKRETIDKYVSDLDNLKIPSITGYYSNFKRFFRKALPHEIPINKINYEIWG